MYQKKAAEVESIKRALEKQVEAVQTENKSLVEKCSLLQVSEGQWFLMYI